MSVISGILKADHWADEAKLPKAVVDPEATTLTEVRKHQQQMIVNERFRWIGDVHGEEAPAATSGNFLNEDDMETCVLVQRVAGAMRPLLLPPPSRKRPRFYPA